MTSRRGSKVESDASEYSQNDLAVNMTSTFEKEPDKNETG
jgi:hypothetical protein